MNVLAEQSFKSNLQVFTFMRRKRPKSPSIHLLSVLFMVTKIRCLSQAVIGLEGGVHLRQVISPSQTNRRVNNHAYTQTHTHTQNDQISVYLDGFSCRIKFEVREKTHECMKRTCKLHAGRPQPGLKPFCCKAAVAVATTMTLPLTKKVLPKIQIHSFDYNFCF